MQVELIIRADSMAEIAHLFVRPPQQVTPLRAVPDEQPAPAMVRETVATPQPETAKEVEPEAPVKKSRSRAKPADAAAESSSTDGSTQSDAGTAASAEPASATSATLEDIRAKASKLLEADPQAGKAIQEMLIEKFDGARAFGALKPEQYADVLGELNNL